MSSPVTFYTVNLVARHFGMRPKDVWALIEAGTLQSPDRPNPQRAVAGFSTAWLERNRSALTHVRAPLRSAGKQKRPQVPIRDLPGVTIKPMEERPEVSPGPDTSPVSLPPPAKGEPDDGR